jgi:putative heme-binding domain-containing protein
MRGRLLEMVVALLGLASGVRADHVQHGLRVPDDFEVVEYAGSELANDIFCMTIDPQGRVIVSGRGYTRILVDEGQGKATRAIDVLTGPKDGAMGLLWECDALYVVGGGGLRRYRGADGKPDSPPELIRALKTGGEHDAHALRRGPDGWLYLLCGNNAGIDRKFAELPTSPIREPIAGCVLRFTPDLKKTEIIADGFRNPYGMDFSPDGELFTFDSDNERCVSLPWYEPTRFYQVVSGGHYGWRGPQLGQFWRLPPYFPDVVAPVATLGRGSPTGVVCYKHTHFPTEYRGGFFLGDWTFGRIYFLALERKGASYAGKSRVFLQSVGDNGFAPTALAVHPQTGELFVSIGGRGTRGAVYRIRYTKRSGPINLREVARLQPEPRPHDAPTRPRVRDAQVNPVMAIVAGAIVAVSQHADARARLVAVRAVQVALGGLTAPTLRGTVWEGYSPRCPVDSRLRGILSRLLKGAFPSGDADFDRELSRTLAMIEDDTSTAARIAAKLNGDSNPIDDVHYLIVLARLRGDWDDALTKRVAGALLALDRKLTERRYKRDTNWPLRISELYTELAHKHPAINAALLAAPEFGRPEHVLFTQAPGFERRRAANVFLARATSDRDFAWSPALVRLVGELPDEQAMPVLRPLWGQRGLDDALLPVLARNPQSADQSKFLAGLSSLQSGTVGISLNALAKLPPPRDATQLLVIVRCLRRLPEGKEGDILRRRIGDYLAQITGQQTLGADPRRWSKWFAATYPALAARLEGADGVDVAGWRKRLAKLDWTGGDAGRGRAVFVKASCAICHSGAQALGPDLHGITGRFSRDDFFTAILLPSKDISPRYRTTAVSLRDGKTYQGLVIYEATDSLLLQTGPATTVRVPAEQIESRRFSDVSLMPTGLLDALKDQEIADLYAYLRSMGK